MRTAIILVAILCISSVGFSATLIVPTQYGTIQAAINAASSGDTVLVKPNTYVENIDFLGKAITVKSEAGPTVTVIDGNQTDSVVLFITGEGFDSLLDGFTVTNGTGHPSGGKTRGGGILCQDASSPTIMNNIITNNSANNGGGIYPRYQSNPRIIKNQIDNNKADYGGGIYCWDSSPEIRDNSLSWNTVNNEGAGMLCSSGCFPVVDGNIIRGNSAAIYGGGLEFYDSCGPIITNNIIMENEAVGNAGGGIIVTYYCSGTIANNIIAYNTCQGTTYGGGGIAMDRYTETEIINNIIYGNSANRGGGIDVNKTSTPLIKSNTIFGNFANNGGGISCKEYSHAIVVNNILWDNVATQGPEIYIVSNVYPSSIDISYSDVKGGQSSVYVAPNCTCNWGSGMITTDPLFVDESYDDLHLTALSPCKDAGDNTAVSDPTDYEGDPRISGGTVDMGADEFYTHLYYTRNATPGGTVHLNFVGAPGTAQVALIIGFSVFDPPLPGAYGDWYIAPPILLFLGLGPVPSNGVYVLPGPLPPSVPGPYTLYLQAMIGYQLTNLCVMKVE